MAGVRTRLQPSLSAPFASPMKARIGPLESRTSGGGTELRHIVRPHFEVLQSVFAEGCGDGHIGRISATGDKNASDPRHVVAWIENVPGAPDISFKPSRKIPDAPRQRCSHIAEIPGAVARRNIQAAAERD